LQTVAINLEKERVFYVEKSIQNKTWFTSIHSNTMTLIHHLYASLNDRAFRSRYGIIGFSKKRLKGINILKITDDKNKKDVIEIIITSSSASLKTNDFKVSVDFDKRVTLSKLSADGTLSETQYMIGGKQTIKQGENSEVQKPLKTITLKDRERAISEIVKNIKTATLFIPARTPLKKEQFFRAEMARPTLSHKNLHNYLQ